MYIILNDDGEGDYESEDEGDDESEDEEDEGEHEPLQFGDGKLNKLKVLGLQCETPLSLSI